MIKHDSIVCDSRERQGDRHSRVHRAVLNIGIESAPADSRTDLEVQRFCRQRLVDQVYGDIAAELRAIKRGVDLVAKYPDEGEEIHRRIDALLEKINNLE